jgi:hypothetical protein
VPRVASGATPRLATGHPRSDGAGRGEERTREAVPHRRPTIRRTAAWFAVLALLAHTVIFDAAMAALETAAARE